MSQFKNYSLVFKEVLNLDYEPVGIRLVDIRLVDKKETIPSSEKIRICRSLIDVAKDKKSLVLTNQNNACFGASWHLGFQRMDNPRIMNMVKKFVVEGEKLFSSYSALDNLISQMGDPPDNSQKAFVLSPLEELDSEPQLVIFLVNPEQACRLLTLLVFIEGDMPRIKIGGPTCRMAIIYPLVSKQANISFYDYTARKICNLEKDKLLVSIPYQKFISMLENIDKCSAGRGKIEYPQEFRDFLARQFRPKQ